MTFDNLLPVRELARLVGSRRKGRPTHVGTIIRSHKDGLRGVNLHLTRVGGIWMGSEADLRAFIGATQDSTGNKTAAGLPGGQNAHLDFIEQQLDQAQW